MNKITILGLGNPLLKDDGIGPHIISILQHSSLPAGIEALWAGGYLYSYLNILVNSEKVIVVDALQGGGPPGTFYLLPADKLFLDHETGLFRHEDDFFSVLECLKCYNTRTELIIVGVEPLEISYSLELSPQIKQRIPDLIELILNLCRDSKLNSSLNQQNSK